MGHSSRVFWLAGCLLAALVTFAACGESTGQQGSTRAGQPQPPPDNGAEPAGEPGGQLTTDAGDGPGEDPGDGARAAPPPPTSPSPAADPPPSPVEAPPADPPPPTAAGAAVDALDVQGVLDAALETQAAARSVEYEMFLTMEVGFDGLTMVSADEVPLGRVLAVGPLTLQRYDLNAISALDPTSAGGGLPPMEFIGDSETGEFYARLGPLVEPGALEGEPLPDWLAAAVEESGEDVSDLWLDAGSAATGGGLSIFDDLPAAPDMGEFLALVVEAVAADAIVEATYLGRDEVLGLPVNAYRLIVDAGSVAGHLPAFLGEVLGEDPSEEISGEMVEALSQLTEPLLVDTYLAVDDAGAVRRLVQEIDLAPLMASVFGAFGEMDGGDAGEAALPEFDYLLGTRIDVVALDDPSAAVELPDPSLILRGPR